MIGGRNGPPPAPKPVDTTEDWMGTFADMATLLLTFFILLASISKVDQVAYEKMQASMAEGIGNRKVDTPIESVRQEMAEVLKSLQVDDSVGLGTDSQGVTLEFAASSFYAPGSAEFLEEAVPILNKIALTLTASKYNGFLFEIQGHTDDTPIHTLQYPSNWELSGARASRVVRYFLDIGIAPERMRSVGLADTAPKVPNRDPQGSVLPQNQEVNRRVVVRIFPR